MLKWNACFLSSVVHLYSCNLSLGRRLSSSEVFHHHVKWTVTTWWPCFAIPYLCYLPGALQLSFNKQYKKANEFLSGEWSYSAEGRCRRELSALQIWRESPGMSLKFQSIKHHALDNLTTALAIAEWKLLSGTSIPASCVSSLLSAITAGLFVLFCLCHFN